MAWLRGTAAEECGLRLKPKILAFQLFAQRRRQQGPLIGILLSDTN
jgi:hypothetical protein